MSAVARKRRTREHVIADLSVNHVERHILRCGYSVERVQHDYGTDLSVYTYDVNGDVESGQFYIQMKATDSLPLLADKRTISFPVGRRDLARWLHEPMPYFLIVYDAQADVAYWMYVQATFERRAGFSLEQAPNRINMHIPVDNVVDESAVRRFAAFRDTILSQTAGVIRHGD